MRDSADSATLFDDLIEFGLEVQESDVSITVTKAGMILSENLKWKLKAVQQEAPIPFHHSRTELRGRVSHVVSSSHEAE